MISPVLFIALAITLLNASSAHASCSVSVNGDLTEPQPLVLVRTGLNVDFVNPVDNSGTLSFATNEEFRLACPGSGNYLMGVGNNNIQDIAAFCVSGKTFRVNSAVYEFRNLVCRTLPLSVVRRTGNSCLSGYSQVEIGYDLGNDFLRTIEVCRDDSAFSTLYTKLKLTKSIGGFQLGYPRPSWVQEAGFWGSFNMNTQYSRAVQRATVSSILQSTALGDKYISSTSDFFFSRGHLVAKADFVYGSAHWSTFWYVNSQPQWQTFNGGNWNDLELDVRAYASSSKLDLDVYTGTHGIMTLPDVNNVEQPMYFYASGQNRALPIPLFFWKIIYDPISRRGTAFVGVNHPYIINLTADYYICDDISNRIPWLTWRADNIARGISYACTVDDLRRVIPTVPQLTVVGILT